jgi:hypothetical protein
VPVISPRVSIVKVHNIPVDQPQRTVLGTVVCLSNKKKRLNYSRNLLMRYDIEMHTYL